MSRELKGLFENTHRSGVLLKFVLSSVITMRKEVETEKKKFCFSVLLDACGHFSIGFHENPFSSISEKYVILQTKEEREGGQ